MRVSPVSPIREQNLAFWLPPFFFVASCFVLFMMVTWGGAYAQPSEQLEGENQEVVDISQSGTLERMAQEPSPVTVLRASTQSGAAPKKQTYLPIIMYHYIEDLTNSKDVLRKKMAVAPTMLEHQLKVLEKDGYETLFVRDVPGLLGGETTASSKRIVLTFDDGYEDFYTDAFPLLKKYNMKSTLYVITHFLDKPGYLTSEQLREIIKSGIVEIGAHTQTHPNLATLSETKAREEIFGSKEELERWFGITVETFAYPYGGYKAKTEELVKEAGFSAAVSTDKGKQQSESKIMTLYRLRAGILMRADVVGAL